MWEKGHFDFQTFRELFFSIDKGVFNSWDIELGTPLWFILLCPINELYIWHQHYLIENMAEPLYVQVPQGTRVLFTPSTIRWASVRHM